MIDLALHNSKRFDTTPITAVLACVTLTLLFIASLYVSRLYSSKLVSRDDPAEIRRRIVGVCIVTAIAPWLISYFAIEDPLNAQIPFSAWLGWRWNGLLYALVLPLMLVATLFLGPLVMKYQDEELPTQRNSDFSRSLDLRTARDLIIGPVVEEIVFRTCMIPLLVPAFGPVSAIWLTPLFFGAAHLHHVLDHVHSQKRTVRQAWAFVLFQFGYTTVFGLMTSFVFVRTGHALAPCLMHVFCNCMGFPDVAEAMERSWKVKAAFMAGLTLFFVLLFPLTSPSLYSTPYLQYM